MYEALEGAGYVRDRDIRVAGYDSRLTPDMRHFLQRTKDLIVDTYRDNGRRPVHLVGHSNGPLYAQYLLTHTNRRWKHRYIHGFTPIAGNFPGQGIVYALFFTGLNITDFTFPTTTENAASSARMYLSAPSTYMSSSDPKVFDSLETIIVDSSTGRSYTPDDYRRLFRDAGLPLGEAAREPLHRLRRLHRPVGLPRCRRLRRERLGNRDAGRPFARRPLGRPGRSTTRTSSSRETATSTRKTSRTTPCSSGRRCRASTSA